MNTFNCNSMEVKQELEEVNVEVAKMQEIFLPVKIEPNYTSEFSKELKSEVEVDTSVIKNKHKLNILEQTKLTNIRQKQLNKIKGNQQSSRKTNKKCTNRSTMKPNRRWHFCPVCHKKFLSSLVSRKHLDSHFRKHLAGCSLCGKFFKTKKDFFIHFRAHYISKQKIKTRKVATKVSADAVPNTDPIKVDPTFNCIHCSTVFFTKDSLDSHMTSHYHATQTGYNSFLQEYFTTFSVFGSFPPKKTGNKTPAVVKIESGINETSKEMPSTIKVNSTNKEETTPKLNENDFARKIPTDSLTCEMCLKQCFSKSSLLRHREEHTRIKCILCADVFASADFKSHLKVHTSKEPYCCKICSKIFRRAATLQQHLYVHQTEKKEILKCQICSSEFDKYAGFVSHFKKLHGELKGTAFSEPLITTNVPVVVEDKSAVEEEKEEEEIMEEGLYKCDWCPKTFDIKKTFERHMASHTFCKLCIICLEPFTSRHLLKKHLAKHCKQKPYVCPICTRYFSVAKSLEKHLHLEQRQDSEDIVMKCTICDSPVHYFSKIDLLSHFRNNHVPNFDRIEASPEKVIIKEEFNFEGDELCIVKKEAGDINDLLNTELDIKEEIDINQDFRIKEELNEPEVVSK